MESTVNTSSERIFLGIKSKYTNDRKVRINMKDYIEEVIEDFDEDVTKKVATPAARWLFNSGHARKLQSN